MHAFRRTRVGALALLALVTAAAVSPAAPTRATATTTERAAAATTEPAARQLPDDLSVKIVERRPGVVRFVVSDTSGRDVTNGAAGPTPSTRTIAVTALFPPGPDGGPGPARLPVLVLGGYRWGETARDCLVERGGRRIVVCIGFAQADEWGIVNHADISNDPGDVSRVLDLLTAQPDLAGKMKTRRIVYSGSSRGGLAGFQMVHPATRDTRIRAVVAWTAFAPYWVPEFSRPRTWAAAPKVLMVNGLRDDIITYELARKTFQNAGGSPKLQLVSVPEMAHFPNPCPAVDTYVSAWTAWQLGLAGRPAARTIDRSTCAQFGVMKGGTTGDGAAGVFVPRN